MPFFEGEVILHVSAPFFSGRERREELFHFFFSSLYIKAYTKMFSEEDLHFNRAHNSYYSSVYYWIDSILRVRPICMPEIAAGDGLLISYLR